MSDAADRLRAQIAAGELEADAAQLEVAQRLDALAHSLQPWKTSRARLATNYAASRKTPRGL
jgi:hypothetical protein